MPRVYVLKTGVRLALLLTGLWLGSARPQSAEDVVARQNVGTVFKLHHKPLLMNVGHADLTLTIPYYIEPPSLRDMSTATDFRKMIQDTELPHAPHLVELSHRFDNMTLEIYEECMALYTDVATILANPKQSTYARVTREFIQYISPLPYGIIGLARQQSVEMLFQHMLTVDRAINNRDDQRLATDRLVRLLSSEQLNIKKALNTEADRMSQMISSVNGSLVYIAGQIQRITTDHIHDLRTENTIFSVLVTVLADMLSMAHYLDRYTPFLEALHSLNNGQLPHQLVSQAEISKAYVNMTLFLEEHFNNTDHEGTTLTPLTEQELFGSGLTTFMYTATHLFAHLRVPTYHPRERLHLYSVDIMPVPFHTHNVSALGYTMLDEKPNRFALAPLVGSHVSFDHSKIAHCTDLRHFLICDFPMATRPAGFDTCFSAIFEGNNITKIQNLCSFKAFPTKTTPSVAISLGNNNFAIATAFESYSVKCQTSISTLRTPCGFCIVSLPPACSLSLTDLEIASTPMGLNRSMVIETHAVNLPLALAFELPVTDLSAAFAHTAPIVLDLPVLSLKQTHKLPFTKEALQQGVELTAMAAAIQQYDKMSAAHRATVDFVNTVSNPITNTVILIFNICLAIIMGIIIKKVFGISRQITCIYQTLTLLKPAETAPSPSPQDMMLLSKVTPPVTLGDSPQNSFNYDTHLLAAILILITLWMLARLVKWLGKNLWFKLSRTAALTANPALKLKIYAQSNNYLFHLLSFKAEVNALRFLEVPTLTDIKYNGGPHATLTWSQPLTFSICDQISTSPLCSSVPIPTILRYDLKRALLKAQSEGLPPISALILKAPNQPGMCLPPASVLNLKHNITPTKHTPSYELNTPVTSTHAGSTEDHSDPTAPARVPVIIMAEESRTQSQDEGHGLRLLRAIAQVMTTPDCQVEST